MLVKALRSFMGRYGHIRAGTTFECEPSYYKALLRNRMVEEVTDAAPSVQVTPAPGPKKNRSIPTAPRKKGTPDNQGGKSGSSEPSQADGKGITSSSLRVDLASAKKTPRKSGAGVITEKNSPQLSMPKTPPAAG